MADIFETISDLNNKTSALLEKYDNVLNKLPNVVSTTIDEKNAVLASGTITEFKLVENGSRLRYSTDDINQSLIDDGYELFCPHDRNEYDHARKYLIANKKPKAMGPLGIYYPDDGPGGPTNYIANGWCSSTPLNSKHMGKKGWKVKDGNKVWWASDLATVTEPNGDYKANAYLGISYDNDGNVIWYNDGRAAYSYTTYLCVKRVK